VGLKWLSSGLLLVHGVLAHNNTEDSDLNIKDHLFEPKDAKTHLLLKSYVLEIRVVWSLWENGSVSDWPASCPDYPLCRKQGRTGLTFFSTTQRLHSVSPHHSFITMVATSVILLLAILLLTLVSNINVWKVFSLTSCQHGSVALRGKSVHSPAKMRCCQLKINSQHAAFCK
jgi:hypothetical protein